MHLINAQTRMLYDNSAFVGNPGVTFSKQKQNKKNPISCSKEMEYDSANGPEQSH